MRQRLAIGQAIIHDPEFILLDEPAAGLDPEARHHLSQLLLNLQAEGKTIMVSSHILAELNEYSSHMLVIKNGEIQSHSQIDEAEKTINKKMILKLSSPMEGVFDRLENFAGLVEKVKQDGLIYEFQFNGNTEIQQKFLKQLLDEGTRICSFTEQKLNIQEIYLNSNSD